MIKKLTITAALICMASTIIGLSAWSVTGIIRPPATTIKVVGRTLPGELNTIIWVESGLGYIVLDSLEACALGVNDSVDVYITFYVEKITNSR